MVDSFFDTAEFISWVSPPLAAKPSALPHPAREN
jgi:hypothetical protein